VSKEKAEMSSGENDHLTPDYRCSYDFLVFAIPKAQMSLPEELFSL
jgi:hypothetical protein